MKKYILMLALIYVIVFTSCSKFLDESPDASLVVPRNITDLLVLLDNNAVMNYPLAAASEVSADNYYVTFADWNSSTEDLRNQYIWEKELYFEIASDWSQIYTGVNYCNIVLEHLPIITIAESDVATATNVRGMAHFFRGSGFHHLLQTYSKAYDPATSATDLGIVLKLVSDFNVKSVRASVEDSYQQVISDLKTAVQLLPVIPQHRMRPSRPAAYGLLARVYLNMGKYEYAKLYADSALSLYSTLMDYNNHPDITPSATTSFKIFNAETIMFMSHASQSILATSRAKIDSNLYQSYSSNDLRKTLFFSSNNNGTFGFKGSYSGATGLVPGIIVDELYLIRSECNARLNNIAAAMEDLNTLLITRWKTGTFVPFTATTSAGALSIILTERRKELLYRSLRWSDIKRLNKEGAGITLRRILNGTVYELLPNANHYALPLPDKLIQQTGIVQNPH